LWTALFWGAFTSAALYLGQLLARPIGSRNPTTTPDHHPYRW
jgi:hypothetical protein